MPQFNIWNWILKGGDDSFMLRTKKTTQEKLQNMNELITKKAYELYEKNGCQQGNDIQNWIEAERLVKRSMRQR